MSVLRLSIVDSGDVSETSSSSICRAYLAVETLRERKLAAGSWAVLTPECQGSIEEAVSSKRI